jgi:7-keto-8-aminopelargonate synthetase-like enzyme
MSENSIIQTVNEIANHARLNGIAHLNTQDKKLTNNIITVESKKTVHFGSCSYLGLEFDSEAKEAAKAAIDAYGTQFSSSRAYVSTFHYFELEQKFEKIFGSPTVVAPTTTLGHIATIPVFVNIDDAIILDHQVHNSVQTAAGLMKGKGTHIELLRHNRMDLLENRILELRGKHKKIWYMADGIYSMYGDVTPIAKIHELLNKYPEFHFYVDDAHAMSCFGEHGRGFVLSKHKIHSRMIVVTSLAKAFATGGSALIFPTKEMAQLVRNVGGPMITSGPMQPAALGAALAIADIHLSEKINEYQEELQENIKYTDLMLKKYGLPNLSEAFSPIFFIAVSLPKIAYSIINKMKNDGFFLNIGIFPAVPIKNTGVRFTITRLHTFDQIERMVACLSKNFNLAIAEQNVSIETIYKAFKLPTPFEKLTQLKVNALVNESKLRVSHVNSIHAVNINDWNRTLGKNATMDWNALEILENSFKENDEDFENWMFDYIVIKDLNNEVVLSTFLTTSISKDDMLANKEVSIEVENKRLNDPYFMTSKTLMLGSQITEGNHLYLDKTSELWKHALDELFRLTNNIQNERQISTTMIRDLSSNDQEMNQLMMDNGFFKINAPESFKINDVKKLNAGNYYKSLSKNSKRHYAKFVRQYEEYFTTMILDNPSESELLKCYELYLNIKNQSHAISTFRLPFKLFKEMAKNNNWELVALKLKNDLAGIGANEIVAMAFCYKGEDEYAAVIGGINYSVNRSIYCYRQLMSKIVSRAIDLKMDKIGLGYTCGIEKKHFGAKVVESVAYLQVSDNYKMEAMAIMDTYKKREDGKINERGILSV